MILNKKVDWCEICVAHENFTGARVKKFFTIIMLRRFSFREQRKSVISCFSGACGGEIIFRNKRSAKNSGAKIYSFSLYLRHISKIIFF